MYIWELPFSWTRSWWSAWTSIVSLTSSSRFIDSFISLGFVSSSCCLSLYNQQIKNIQNKVSFFFLATPCFLITIINCLHSCTSSLVILYLRKLVLKIILYQKLHLILSYLCIPENEVAVGPLMRNYCHLCQPKNPSFSPF